MEIRPLIVDLKGVTVQQSGRPVLEDVFLQVHEGEMVYVVGRTGSGKSSLLKTLYGENPLMKGAGYVAGMALHNLKRRQIPELRKRLGIIFQDFRLLTDRTVYDNLDFVLRATGWKDKKRRRARIGEVLEMIGMTHVMHKPAFALSGGEQQKVAIARALLNNPKLILADEPTGNLDPQTKEEILELFKKINGWNNTVIMATHDYSAILKYPGTIYMCEDGRFYEVEPKTDDT
ncbi:MAG: ATP-binding cassette domain-containing protein [Chlorobi bacterium]|nr:ATP-binding cassette domain-containing protein [Chlorobiota bacterium]